MATLSTRTVLLIGVLLLAGSASVSAQRIVYVNAAATGAGNGTSWADAYREVRTALAAALDGDELWVAAGTYKPTAGTDRAATFALQSGVALYGGFVGTETERDVRDWTLNETVLNGEIGTPGDSTDNSYHVVTATDADSTAVLDGFTVTRGRTFGAARNVGAGMLNVGSSPTVWNCRFVQNTGGAGGGGMYNDAGSRPDVRYVVFESNSASGGGGMVNAGSVVYMERITFRGNLADGGGAMASVDDSVVVCVDCTFEGNTALLDGGAVYDFLSTSTFVRARFVGNTADVGGAVYAEAGSLLCLTCSFEATVDGAAVFGREADLTFVNTAFLGNTTTYRGGALSVDAGSVARLYNVVLAGNRSLGPGGALYAAFARVEAVGLTAAGNRSGSVGQHPGAVLFTEGSTESRLDHAVLWGNTGTSVVGGSGSVAVRRAIVEGGCAPPMTCDRVEDADPLFVRPPLTDGPADYGDLRLLAGSPALDAGLASLLPADVWDLDGDGDTAEPLPLDLSGGPRVLGGGVDLGAYEGGVPVASEPGAPASPLALTVAPNPARGAAVATLVLAEAGAVRVEAYDVLGRRVAVLHKGPLAAGRHRVSWALAGVAPGVYVVRVYVGAEGAVGPRVAARRLVVAGR